MIEINLNRLQKSTHTEWRSVTRDGKTFRQRFNVGRKEVITGFDEFFKSDTTICGNTKDDIDEIIPLHEVGIEGGCHDMDSYIIKYKNGSKAMYKTIEAIEIFGEKATHDIAKMIDWDVIPEVIAGDFGKGIGSVQEWIPGEQPFSDVFGFGEPVTDKHIDDLSKMFLMDMLMGDIDRHAENVIVKDGKVYMIDNEDIGANFSVSKAIKSLDERIAGTNDRYDANSMVSWVNESDDPKILEKLKISMINNMPDVFKKSDDIKRYIESKDYDDMEISKSQQGKVRSILTNLRDMKKYYESQRSL